MATWKDFRLDPALKQELVDDPHSILNPNETVLVLRPGRERLLKRFARAEDRDADELAGMLFEWAIQELVAAGSWSELMKRSGRT